MMFLNIVLLICSFVKETRSFVFVYPFHCSIIAPSRFVNKNSSLDLLLTHPNNKKSTPSTSFLLVNKHKMSATNNNKEEKEKIEEIGNMLGGLVFLKTNMKRETLFDFYSNMIGMSLWLEQPNITIFSHGNMILGFHQIMTNKKEEKEIAADTQGMYTFVYPSKEKVDDMYQKLTSENVFVDGYPRINDKYKIYQFFSQDPEGRKLEFQAFLHPLIPVTSKPPSTI